MNHSDSDKKKYSFGRIAVIFIISRFLYIISGVGFDFQYVNIFHHLMDPELLKNRLYETIYYLHCQPPLFNLWTGLGLKIENDALQYSFFYFSSAACGFLIAYSLYNLMAGFEVPPKYSFIITILFIMSPAVILYENFPFYTYPISSFLIFSAYALFDYLKTGRKLSGFIFFSLIAVISLTASMFHLIWLMVITAGIYLLTLDYPKFSSVNIIKLSAIPFIIVLIFYFKNYYLFGKFTLNTWAGMNIAKMAMSCADPEQKNALRQNGHLSKYFLQMPFAPLEKYETSEIKIPLIYDIPALTQIKNSSKKNNYNNYNYIKISDRLFEDSAAVFKNYPASYFNGLIRAFLFYYTPSTDYPFFNDNLEKIRPLKFIYDKFIYFNFYGNEKSQLYWPNFSSSYKKDLNLQKMILNVSPMLLVLYPLLLIISVITILNNMTKKKYCPAYDFTPDNITAKKITFLYIIFNIFYVTLIGNFFEIGENNRFRFMIDPFYMILLGLLISKIHILIFNRYDYKNE